MPGHGPLADLHAVRELRAYFEYLYAESRTRHEQGMSALEAARSLELGRWADWGEHERLVVNIASIYRELEQDPEPANALLAFQQMASSRAQPGRATGARRRARARQALVPGMIILTSRVLKISRCARSPTHSVKSSVTW